MSTPSKFEEQLKKKKSRGKLCPEAGVAGSTTHILPKDDVRRVVGQEFLVLSYATPDGTTLVRSPRGMVMKFSGAFPDEKSAYAHMAAIRAEDPRFDVFVVDLYKWGQIPMPAEERPYVKRIYADEMLTRIVGGLQASMEQGRKEMEERKRRDREKAAEAMKKALGPEYEMPDKSRVLTRYEDDVRKEREAEVARAAAEGRETRIFYAEADISNWLMQFFAERDGDSVSAALGSDAMKFIVRKAIEVRAQMARAVDGQHPEDDPHAVRAKADVESEIRSRAAAPEAGPKPEEAPKP